MSEKKTEKTGNEVEEIKELNYFEELIAVNVNDKVEEKNGLSYLSWAFAWGELKKRHPTANYTIYENAQGWNYHTDGRTAWVKTGVTIDGIEHLDYMPIMDFKNKSMQLGDITSFDVNKAIQRSITKAIGRHGIGLYIFAGEDLPDDPRAIYAALKDVINKNGLNGNDIAARFNLNKESTAADLKAALAYARGLVR